MLKINYHDPTIPLVNVQLKTENRGFTTCTQTFTAALFTNSKGRNNPISKDNWINQIWHMHTINTLLKRNEILVPATGEANFDNIMLTEIG